MSEIERGRGVAVWRQIEALLTDEVAAGVYKETGRLPTEAVLSQRFGANRHTIRRAIESLVRRGILRVEQGRGTFLAEHAIEYALGPRTRFSENLLRQGRTPRHRVISVLQIAAPADIARALDLVEGSSLIVLDAVRSADEMPISFAHHHFPADRLGAIAGPLSAGKSVSAALAEIGVLDYKRRSTRVTARLPSAIEAKRLQMPITRPVFVTESVNVDSNGRPIEFGVAVMAADRVQLVVEST